MFKQTTTFKSILSATILSAGLFTASLSYAATTILGDSFDLNVSDSNGSLGSASGIAGSAGDDIYIPNTFIIEWLDSDTFQLDFYTSGPIENLTFILSDLDFVDNGTPVDIIGLTSTVVDSAFDWDKDVSFTADSITISYLFLEAFQAADGSIVNFDVKTSPVPVPAAAWLFGSGLIGLIGLARKKT